MTAPVRVLTDVTVLTCAPDSMPPSFVFSAVVYDADVASRIALFAWVCLAVVFALTSELLDTSELKSVTSEATCV